MCDYVSSAVHSFTDRVGSRKTSLKEQHMKSYRTNSLVALCLAGSAFAAPTTANSGAAVTTDVPPPPPRVESVAPREGYVWAPGYWEWNGRFYHWTTGSYIFERRRAHWVADQWVPVGGRWHYLRGRWESTRLLSAAEAPVKAH
jgi:WXXGXW repeat (2 copies)